MISIGKVINTHGIKGELKIWPTTDFPERFASTERVFWERDGVVREFRVEGARRHQKVILLKLETINNMTDAEKLVGGVLKLPEEELVPLPEGSYYLFQIIGLKVFTNSGEEIGTIREVIRTGCNDVYVVDRKSGKEALIPAIRQVVLEINLEEGKMVIFPMEGLLD